jgi:hypothetical protein
MPESVSLGGHKLGKLVITVRATVAEGKDIPGNFHSPVGASPDVVHHDAQHAFQPAVSHC